MNSVSGVRPSAPVVTAVIPCFNQGRFLRTCLASLEAQTETRWRAIIVDDASTDGETPALCDAEINDRVDVLHLWQNQGRALARNAGIAQATTEAVFNLDADDAVAPELFARMVPQLDVPEVGMVYCDMQYFGDRTGRWRARPFSLRRLYRQQYIIGASLFRRSAWKMCGGYHGDFTIGNEDWDLWLRIAELGYVGVWVPAPLYRYRMHAASWTAGNDGRDDRVFRSRLALLQHHRGGFSAQDATAAFLADTHAAEARRLAKRGDSEGARHHWQQVAQQRPWDWLARWRGR